MGEFPSFICPKHSPHGMALTRETHPYGQFTTATAQELQKLWHQAEHKVNIIDPLLVFNPTTGTYPTVSIAKWIRILCFARSSPDLRITGLITQISTLILTYHFCRQVSQSNIRIQQRLGASQLASLRSSIVVDQDHLLPAEHRTFQTDKSSTMNSCEAPRPIPRATDIENIARMVLTFRRQFRYSWEQIVEFLKTIGFVETRVGEVIAIFEKYEQNETMGSMHGIYET